MIYAYSTELAHHGVKGQKWGERKYQNEDGTLTSLGREHYGYGYGVKSNGKIGGQGVYLRNLKKDYKRKMRENNIALGRAQDKYESDNDGDAYDRSTDRCGSNLKSLKAEYRQNKKEYKRDVKNQYKYGGVNSINDTLNGGKGTEYYNKLVSTKGKSYADSVQKASDNKAWKTIATSATVATGANIAAVILTSALISKH